MTFRPLADLRPSPAPFFSVPVLPFSLPWQLNFVCNFLHFFCWPSRHFLIIVVKLVMVCFAFAFALAAFMLCFLLELIPPAAAGAFINFLPYLLPSPRSYGY